jgi:thioredoxin reductase/NAD-dependent dihydropyrimidine dehydrogenase PreA subunit
VTTPRLVATSDVTRFRGVAVAAIVAALVAIVGAVAMWPRGHRSPGPLSASHRKAGVACASCHTKGTDEPPPSTACARCHGKHASTRPGHAALRTSNTLACAGCHGGHHDHDSVTFFPDGRAIRRDDVGDRDAFAPSHRFRPTQPITVPLLDASRCAHCHDATRAPLSTCTTNGVVTCFDEHTPVRAPDGAIAARAAAWDAARAVADSLPSRPRPLHHATGPWLVLALATLAALLAWSLFRFPVSRFPLSLSSRPSSLSRHPYSSSPLPVAGSSLSPSPSPSPSPRLPVINVATCLGCNACVEACPYDVLEVRRYVAVVARPDACCGLTLCASVCPNQSLVMQAVTGTATPTPTPTLSPRTTLESPDAPNIFLAGDAGGGSLIRNAVDDGARAIAAIAAQPRAKHADSALLDVLIIGAGPAGLSASLEARARGLRALTLEQGTIASSIQSFPRGKLVLDAAPPDAAPPRLWLAETTKEELLARWMLTIRTEQPPLLDHRRVTSLDRATDGTWRIESTATTTTGAPMTHRARAVVIAVGRRGSPRRLAVDVPASMASHVHYALADAASFAHRRILVVGAGDVAMETAIALSRQPGTDVVMSYRGADLRRGRARNIAELRRRIAAGAVRMIWSSEVSALTTGTATLATPSGTHIVGCDSIFVMIGSDAAPAAGDLLSRLTNPLPTLQTDRPHHAFDTR